MRENSSIASRFGIPSAWVVLVWPAIAVAGTALAEAGSLPGIRDNVAALQQQPALAVPAAQLDFAARDIQVEPGVEIPLSLRLPSPEQLQRAGSETGAFILIRNIPSELSLSEGMPIGTNWIMSLPQAGRARLVAKEELGGHHRLEFLLIGPGNRVLAETSVVAKPAPAAPSVPREVVVERPVAAVAVEPKPEKRPAPPKRSISEDEESILLSKGAELVGQGGIAGARLIFEELAQQGSSYGALALARTYDPAYVAAAPSGSIVPDIPKALAWYKKASDLGSGEASQRISQLNTRR
jgi:hypothetical protein